MNSDKNNDDKNIEVYNLENKDIQIYVLFQNKIGWLIIPQI